MDANVENKEQRDQNKLVVDLLKKIMKREGRFMPEENAIFAKFKDNKDLDHRIEIIVDYGQIAKELRSEYFVSMPDDFKPPVSIFLTHFISPRHIRFQRLMEIKMIQS